MKTIISGSFSKHFGQMLELAQFLRQQRVEVLSPMSPRLTPENVSDFILLESDPVEDPRTLQDSVYAKIRCCSFIVLANVDGYVGLAAAMEIGFATSLGLQVLALEPVKDPNLAGYCRLASDVFPGIEHVLSLPVNIHEAHL